MMLACLNPPVGLTGLRRPEAEANCDLHGKRAGSGLEIFTDHASAPFWTKCWAPQPQRQVRSAAGNRRPAGAGHNELGNAKLVVGPCFEVPSRGGQKHCAPLRRTRNASRGKPSSPRYAPEAFRRFGQRRGRGFPSLGGFKTSWVQISPARPMKTGTYGSPPSHPPLCCVPGVRLPPGPVMGESNGSRVQAVISSCRSSRN